MLAPHSLANAEILAYVSGGAAFADKTTTSVSGLNIHGNMLDEITSAASESGLQSDLAAAIGSNASVHTLVEGLANRSIDSTAATFTIDAAIGTHAGDLTIATGTDDSLAIQAALTGATADLVSGGTISQTAAGIVTALTLTGSAAGSATLAAANEIGELGTFTIANQNLTLTDAGSLAVRGAVDMGTGDLTLATTGTGHNLALQAALSGTTVDLVSAGATSGTSMGIITASELTGTSGEQTTLVAADEIGNSVHLRQEHTLRSMTRQPFV